MNKKAIIHLSAIHTRKGPLSTTEDHLRTRTLLSIHIKALHFVTDFESAIQVQIAILNTHLAHFALFGVMLYNRFRQVVKGF